MCNYPQMLSKPLTAPCDVGRISIGKQIVQAVREELYKRFISDQNDQVPEQVYVLRQDQKIPSLKDLERCESNQW